MNSFLPEAAGSLKSPTSGEKLRSHVFRDDRHSLPIFFAIDRLWELRQVFALPQLTVNAATSIARYSAS